jgi:hypothetical protein
MDEAMYGNRIITKNCIAKATLNIYNKNDLTLKHS